MLSEFLHSWQIVELKTKLLQQLLLVGWSLASAIIIAIPAGIIARRFKKWRVPLLSISSVLQTIPSLALLAMLLPFFGIGMKPAIIALTLYAILPILRNTLTGLQQISPVLLEVANACGFTRWQRLYIVELPLALPMIIAGIRTAAAMTVGIATIAAFIGAGGLGDFINRGLAMNNTQLLLLGAIPAALMALFFDGLFAWLQTRLDYHHPRSRQFIRYFLIGCLLLLGIGGSTLLFYESHPSITQDNTIHIGSKNFTEQNILGEILAQLIQAKTNLKVEKLFNLGTTDICQQALLRGEIDLYPEYTGTAYMTVLHQTQPQTAATVLAIVRRDYAQQFHLTWLAPFGFNNSQSLTVTQAFAQSHHLHSISDLKPYAPYLTLGAPAEFIDRPDGLSRLQQVYHLHFAHIVGMDPGLMYQAIAQGHVQVIDAFTTDGRIKANHLEVLQDDKGAFPAYQAATVIRTLVLQQHPQLSNVINALAGKITDTDMRQMNYAVDVKKQSPATVAHQFLEKKHLL